MFIKRSAEDDLEAIVIMDAMEQAGATVVSVTTRGESKYDGALEPHQMYDIWARLPEVPEGYEPKDEIVYDSVDNAIHHAIVRSRGA